MSKIKILGFAVVALILLNLVLVGFMLNKKGTTLPPPPPGMGQGQMQGPKQIIIDRLQLDSQQVSAYELLIEEHKSNSKLLNDSIAATRNTLYQLLKTDNNNGKAEYLVQLGRLNQAMEAKNFEHFEALKKLCKPEQLPDFLELTNELAAFFSKGGDRNQPPRNNGPEERPH